MVRASLVLAFAAALHGAAGAPATTSSHSSDTCHPSTVKSHSSTANTHHSTVSSHHSTVSSHSSSVSSHSSKTSTGSSHTSTVSTSSSSLPSGVLSVPLIRIRNNSAYGAEVKAGTPPQSVYLLVDTGSPTIGLESPRGNLCSEPGKPCAEYSTYNNLTSSTAKYLNNTYIDELVDEGSGSYIRDTIQFGSGTLKNAVFGQILSYGRANLPPLAGILGFGQNCETQACDSYQSLQQQLVESKVIRNRLLSVYLGPEVDHPGGELVLSGIDLAKRNGPVVTIPMYNVTSALANNAPYYIPFSSFGFENNSTTKTHPKPTSSHYELRPDTITLLDTGNPYVMLPNRIFNGHIAPYFGLNVSTLGDVPYSVDCGYRAGGKLDDPKVALTVGFANNVFKAHVPMNRLVTEWEGQCTLTAYGFPNDPYVQAYHFGDALLRSLYMTFDLDRQTVQLSNVTYTNATDIVAA